MSKEIQVNPNFEKIVPLCIKELDIKFPDYGNSWQTLNKTYWQQRIRNEVDEYQNSMTSISEKRKLLNIMNMCAMAYETTKDETKTNP